MQPELRAEVIEAVESIPIDYGGGSSWFKGALMASLIVQYGLKRSVEIGVHRGRSLVALGIGASKVADARVWGVDPYSSTAYPDTEMAGEAPVGLADWVDTHDFRGAHAEAQGALSRLGLDCVTILVEPAEAAAPRFEPGSIDLLHVDGNHSEETVRVDLELYLPLVRPGGFVVLDDISWASVQRAAEEPLRGVPVLFELMDRGGLAELGVNDFRICQLPATS